MKFTTFHINIFRKILLNKMFHIQTNEILFFKISYFCKILQIVCKFSANKTSKFKTFVFFRFSIFNFIVVVDFSPNSIKKKNFFANFIFLLISSHFKKNVKIVKII